MKDSTTHSLRQSLVATYWHNNVKCRKHHCKIPTTKTQTDSAWSSEILVCGVTVVVAISLHPMLVMQ